MSKPRREQLAETLRNLLLTVDGRCGAEELATTIFDVMIKAAELADANPSQVSISEKEYNYVCAKAFKLEKDLSDMSAVYKAKLAVAVEALEHCENRHDYCAMVEDTLAKLRSGG